MADIQVQGLAELDALLKTLPARVEANILRGAGAGQKVVADRAKAEVSANSMDTGALRKSIRVRVDRRAQKRGYVRADVVAGDATAWYAHLIEFGTGSYYEGTGRSVRKPYVIKARDADGKRYGNRELRRSNKGSNESALYFQGKMYSKVIHPGIVPEPYMREAATLLDGPLLEAFAQYVRTRLPKELAKAAT